jgi:hypothetical protein
MFYLSKLSEGTTDALSLTAAEFRRSTRQIRRCLGDDAPKRYRGQRIVEYAAPAGDAQQAVSDLEATLTSFGNNEWGPEIDRLLSGVSPAQIDRMRWWIDHSPYYRKTLRQASVIKSMKKILLTRLRNVNRPESAAKVEGVGTNLRTGDGINHPANADTSHNVEPPLLCDF